MNSLVMIMHAQIQGSRYFGVPSEIEELNYRPFAE